MTVMTSGDKKLKKATFSKEIVNQVRALQTRNNYTNLFSILFDWTVIIASAYGAILLFLKTLRYRNSLELVSKYGAKGESVRCAFKAEASNEGFQLQSKPPVHTGNFDY
ncbi:hypothetical protein HXA35_01550 [Bacillus sp. A301a_S52]|jgi:hypothetical protein|nr:hypothetical protein [Bacillus sp. A301a_S52]